MKSEIATADPCKRAVYVLKSLTDAGQRTSPDVVSKRFEELSLAGCGQTLVKLLARENLQNDPLLTKPQAYADACRSPAGRIFASFDRLPFAQEPVAKAIELIEGMGRGRGGWAEDLLNRLTAIDRGWV